MDNIQTKPKILQKLKPSSYYHKYQCDTCNYFTNYKNSYNKHTKSAKHLALNPPPEQEKVQTEALCSEVTQEEPQVQRETINDEFQPEVIMDASMGFITIEEVKKDTKTDNTFKYDEYQLGKIVDLMDQLNSKINSKKNDDVEMKCVYFGLGVLFHLVFFNLLVGGQWSHFFELSR